MKKIYCLSGLGADERIFANLRIDGAELVHLPWPEYDEHDELPCYAQKMSALIKDENPILLGVSFGGMLAVEIAKIRKVEKVIIVSSAKTKEEIPHFGRFMKFIVTKQVVPAVFFTWPNRFVMQMFGAAIDIEKEMLKGVFRATDGYLVRWAMKAIQLWRNSTYPEPIVHIHGDADKIITPEYIHADYWIKGGSHIMIYNKAEEINTIINKELKNGNRL
ncbi:MAG: alpha/beta hydrolase [Flavipsychrobacter sp.]|nr:alpha/beta hydrolase [Flavipsychrobacter sp.]